jgi:hypothetical protein
MKFNIDSIPLFNYKNGDEVTAADVNAKAIEVYNKFNFLNPNNIDTINTGMYYDSVHDLYYPNYCGYHMSEATRQDEIGIRFGELAEEIEEIINLYKEVE